MPALRLRQSRAAHVLTLAVLVGVTAAACGRSSSSTPSGGGSSSSSTAAAPSSSAAVAAGDFGSAKKVCAPGTGAAGSGRGIVGKTIHIGVLADPGAAAAPGLGQEFFDVADAFSKWCNAAGGINGKTIVVDKLDAKLFNGGSEIIQACQRDFMVVGGANALDQNTVKPREACKLGSIPAYTASPEAYESTYQVVAVGSVPTIYPIAPLRLLANAYPDTKQGLGIAGSSLASLTPQGLRAQEGWQKLGYKVSTLQARPALVPNYRPYLAQMKQQGAKADFEIVAQDASPIFTAMNDTGFKPEWLLFGQTFYSPKSVQAAKATASFPATYVNLNNLPWELASQFPVVQQAKDIMAAGPGTAGLDAFTDLAFNSWVLWAQAATECGSDLTQDCVLAKAGSRVGWDAGGLFPKLSKALSEPQMTDCTLFVRLTTSGWVYDKKVTQPNSGPYNCGSDNLVTVKSYLQS